MKTINIRTASLITALLSISLSMKAQPNANAGYAPDGVVMTKNVIEGDNPNTYTINLETFVTGESIVTETGGPLDAILVLDFSSSMLTNSKFENLMGASAEFLNSIKKYKEDNNADAKVGVITFGDGLWNLTEGLVDPAGEEIAELISDMELTAAGERIIRPSGNTRIDLGIEEAKNWLSDNSDRTEAHKCVIVFTDGYPYGGEYSEISSPEIASNAVNFAYDIKNTYHADIYTIGVLSSTDMNKMICYNGTNSQSTPGYGNSPLTTTTFLDRLSSNYPEARIRSTSISGNNTQINYESGWSTPKYNDPENPEFSYSQVVGATELSTIFQDISQRVIGGASYELTVTSLTVIDIVSPAFKLPDGADGSKISLSVARCYGVQSTGPGSGDVQYLFETPIELPNALFPDVEAEVGVLTRTQVGDHFTVTFTPQVDGKTVSVTGFDFSANYVGLRTPESGSPYYDGYKLIISFPIEIDPDNPGGATENTNTADSGIYTDNGDGKGYQQIGGFEIPTVKIPNIVVIKNGLKKGDSAIFNLYKIENDGAPSQIPIVLVATCKEDGQPAIAKTKIQKVGRYMVEETKWSWAYGISSCQGSYPGHEDSSSITLEQWHDKGFGSPGESGYAVQIPDVFGTETTTNSITRNVNDFTEEENTALGYKGTVFIFTNEAKTGTPAHAETYNNNEFFKTTK